MSRLLYLLGLPRLVAIAPQSPIGPDGDPTYSLAETASQTMGVITEATDAFTEGMVGGGSVMGVAFALLAAYKGWMMRKAKQEALLSDSKPQT